VQTDTIVFFFGKKIKFSLAVLIFGSRSMVAMYMGVTLRAHLVRGESHIQGNDNRGVATVPKAKFC